MVWFFKRNRSAIATDMLETRCKGRATESPVAVHHTCVRQGLQIVEECVGRAGRCWALLGAVPPNNYCFIYFWFMMRAPTRLLRQGGNIKFVQLYFPTFASHNTAIILELLRLDMILSEIVCHFPFFTVQYLERDLLFVHSCYQ